MKKIMIIISFIIFIILIAILSNIMINNDLGNQVVEVSSELDSEISNNIENELDLNLNNSIDGKTIAFIGDSLMEGYGNDYKGFEYYMKDSLPNSKFINNSRSGSTVTDNTGTDNIIMINQVKTLTGNPDILIFNGGINDVIGYGLEFLNNDLKKEIGEVKLDEVTDKNTVMGDFEEVILKLRKKYANTQLYYLQLFLMDDETLEKITKNKSNLTDIKLRRDKFYNQIKILCKKFNVTYIEIPNKAIETEKQYRQDDWIHLKEEGYKALTPYILEKLK